MMDMPTFLFFILLLIIVGAVGYTGFKFGRHYEREITDGPKYVRNPATQQLEPTEHRKSLDQIKDEMTNVVMDSSLKILPLLDSKPKRKPLSRIIKNPSAEEVRRRHEQEELRKAEAELQTTKREGGTFVK